MKTFLFMVAVTVLACSNALHLTDEYGAALMDAVTEYTHRTLDPKEDCFFMTSEEDEIFVKSSSNNTTVCGIYMIAEPNKRIEVIFNYLDVSCDEGGLVAWVDGWELSGQVWPMNSWDDARVAEFCGQRPRRRFVSRQNAALLQYRIPGGSRFSITIRHLKNSKPCNVLLFGSEGVYTLVNHGEPSNCSIIAVSGAAVRVLFLNVGVMVKKRVLEMETGTYHYCKKRGLPDYVTIGGSQGLDHTKGRIHATYCGLDSKAGTFPAFIDCENTFVELVSSGQYYNTVTLHFTPIPAEAETDLVCGLLEN